MSSFFEDIFQPFLVEFHYVNSLHLTAVALAANYAGFRMFGNHQADDIAAMAQDARCIGQKFHIRCNGGNTRSHQATTFLILHQTEPTGAKGFQIRMKTEVGYLNAFLGRSL